MAKATLWTIQLFGGLRVEGPNAIIDRFPTRRSALLLARVALSHSGSMSRDDLATALWPEDYLDATRHRLRQELNRLRETLGDAAKFLVTDRSWIRLDFANLQVDAREFNRLLSASKGQLDPYARSELRSNALALYQGPLLPEQTEDWVDAERQEFHSKYLAMLIEHTEGLASQGQLHEALACALRAVRTDPYHEPARIAAMRAFVELGDVGGATRQYAEYEKALYREFSVRPSEGLQGYAADIGKGRSTTVQAQVTPTSEVPTEVAASRIGDPPVFLERLIGREAEMSLITGWIGAAQPARLTVVTGPGGVGKTRLAVAAAGAVSQSFQGQVVYVGLADLAPERRVLGKIQEEFGFQGADSGSEPLPHWGARPCLLVLDNVEHVIEDVRRTVKEILVAHPGVVILATSRQRLGLGGEQELPLSPLGVPGLACDEKALADSPAAQLFLDRAKLIRPEYMVSDDQIESLAMLLERLDGLPLAIELAAARVGFLSPEQMLEEIDDRFTFLVSRRSDVEPRQRSLWATIEWSFHGLDEKLREMLGVLAVFRGGCTLDFVRKATIGSDTIDVLQDLVEKSLVHREEGPQGMRFGLLEAIRFYVLEVTAPDFIEHLRATHAKIVIDYVYECSRPLARTDSPEKYEAVRLELDNARSAFDWALEHDQGLAAKAGAALWRFWCARGRPAEGAHYLDMLFASEPEEVTGFWGEALVGRGAICNIMGRHQESVVWFRRAVEAYEQIGDEYGRWWARANLGFAMLDIGQNQEACDLADSELRATSDRYRRMGLLNVRARALSRLGRPEEAMADAEENFSNWVRDPNPLIRGRCYQLLATTYSECGRYDSVQGLLVEALEQLREAKVQDFILRCLLALGQEELRLGNIEAYRDATTEARGLAVKLGDAKTLGSLDALEGRFLAESGESAAKVARCYERAIQPAGETERIVDLLTIAVMAARDMARLGRLDEAKTLLAAFKSLRDSTGCGLTVGETGDRDAALEILGAIDPGDPVGAGKDLAARVLATLARIR